MAPQLTTALAIASLATGCSDANSPTDTATMGDAGARQLVDRAGESTCGDLDCGPNDPAADGGARLGRDGSVAAASIGPDPAATDGDHEDSGDAGRSAPGASPDAGTSVPNPADPYRRCNAAFGLSDNPGCDPEDSCNIGCTPHCPHTEGPGDDCPMPLSGDPGFVCYFNTCVLTCPEGRACPDGMACQGETCRWPPLDGVSGSPGEPYSRCDPDSEESTCPVAESECHPLGHCMPPCVGTQDEGCPLPLIGSGAPQCNFGRCVLRCGPEMECPPMLECTSGYCR